VFARKSTLLIVTEVFAGIAGYISFFLIARLWGGFAPTAIGIVEFGLAFVGMFSFAYDWGFREAHIKRVSEGKNLGKCIGTFLAVKIVFGITAIGLVLLSLFIWQNVLNKGFYDATKEVVIILFLFYYLILNIAHVPLATFEAQKKIAKRQISKSMELVVRLPLIALVVFAGVTGVKKLYPESTRDVIPPLFNWPGALSNLQRFLAAHAIGALAVAYLVGIFVVLLISLYYFRNYPIARPDKKVLRNYTTFALPVTLTAVSHKLSSYLDKVMLGFFWSAHEVGLYTGAKKFTLLLLFAAQAVSMILLPTISGYHTKKKYDLISKIAHQSERFLSLMLFPVITFLVIFPEQTMRILVSGTFTASASSLVYLSIYALIWCIMVPWRYMLLGIDEPVKASQIRLIGFGIHILLNFLLIPSWSPLASWGILGPTGAAVGSAISAAVMLVLYKLSLAEFTSNKISHWHLVLHFLAAVLAGGFFHVLVNVQGVLPMDRWFHLVGVSCGLAGVYVAILWLLKEFTDKDLYMIMDSLNPSKMMSYIKSEIKEK